MKLGEDPRSVFNVECPRNDIVKQMIDEVENPRQHLNNNGLLEQGVGADLNFEENFILFSQHSVTTEYHTEEKNYEETLRALISVGLPVLALWPNSDAGSDKIAKSIRKHRRLANCTNSDL